MPTMIQMREPNAILFDMDGTLTAPTLDFPRIKAEMGIGNQPILEALAGMNATQRQVAEAVLHRHEETAARNCALNAGCTELLACLAERQIAVALITRNSRRSVQTVLQRHRLVIDIQITREDGPHKPDPAPLRMAIERLRRTHSQISLDSVWMVGDGKYDIEAALAAGVKSVWISHGRQRDFPAEPWRAVTDLLELRELVTNTHT